MLFVIMVMCMLQSCQFSSKGCLAFHSCNQLFSGQVIPRCGDNGGISIVLTQQRNTSIQFCLRNGIGTGKDDSGSSFNLIVIELTEVLHINLDLTRICNSNSVANGHILIGDLIDSTNHIGQLTDSGGLNDHAVRLVLLNDLCQSFAEVTDKGAADTAGIHFCNIDAGVLEKTAINADLAELIFNQNQLLAFISFFNHFLDQGCFAGTQKTGEHIYFTAHNIHLSNSM